MLGPQTNTGTQYCPRTGQTSGARLLAVVINRLSLFPWGAGHDEVSRSRSYSSGPYSQQQRGRQRTCFSGAPQRGGRELPRFPEMGHGASVRWCQWSVQTWHQPSQAQAAQAPRFSAPLDAPTPSLLPRAVYRVTLSSSIHWYLQRRRIPLPLCTASAHAWPILGHRCPSSMF